MGCFLKCNPSILNAIPILEVPAYLPMLSSALNKRNIVSFRIIAAGLKSSFSYDFTIFFSMGSLNDVLPSGNKTGLTESTFVNGINSQLFGPAFSSSTGFVALLQEKNSIAGRNFSKRIKVMVAGCKLKVEELGRADLSKSQNPKIPKSEIPNPTDHHIHTMHRFAFPISFHKPV